MCTQKPGESLAAGFDTSKCVKERTVDMNGLQQARMEYGAEDRRIAEQFKADLFETLGISRHPMREKLYSKAWSDGHASGYQEVFNCAQDLVELIELPADAVLVTSAEVTFGPGARNDDTIDAAEKLARKLRG